MLIPHNPSTRLRSPRSTNTPTEADLADVEVVVVESIETAPAPAPATAQRSGRTQRLNPRAPP
jgi:hypothetical protein